MAKDIPPETRLRGRVRQEGASSQGRMVKPRMLDLLTTPQIVGEQSNAKALLPLTQRYDVRGEYQGEFISFLSVDLLWKY